MGDRSLGGVKSFESGGDFGPSNTQVARAYDPQFDPYADIFRYTAPLVVGIASVGLGVLAVVSDKKAVRVTSVVGSLTAGTLALGGLFEAIDRR